jgi:hypothetical protein
MQRIHSIGLGTPGLRMSPRRCCCFAVSRLFSELCVTLSGAYRYLAVPRKGQERACLRTALRSCHASVGPPRPTPTFLPRRACPNPAGQIPDAGTRQSLCSTRQAIFGLPKFAIAALWVARRASASPRTSNPLEPLRTPSDPRVATAGASQGSAQPPTSHLGFISLGPCPACLLPRRLKYKYIGRYPTNRQALLQDLAYDGTAKSGGEDGFWTSTATGYHVQTWT